MYEFLEKGGVLLLPLVGCSVAALAIILERSYRFYGAGRGSEAFKRRVLAFLKEGRIAAAQEVAGRSSGPLARITRTMLAYRGKDREVRKEAVARVGGREIRRMERNLRGLLMISHTAPLLGLLGTVVGMIRAFMEIEALGGGVNASALAGGIWEALITTAAGLAVAVPSLAAHHLFEGRLDRITAAMEELVSEIEEILASGRPEERLEIRSGKVYAEEVGYGV